MVHNFLHLALATSLAFCISSSSAQEVQPAEIVRSGKVFRAANPAVVTQRIAIEFKDSPKLTRLLQNELAAAGFSVVDTVTAADATLRIYGRYDVRMTGMSDVHGSIGELLEKSAALTTEVPGHHQSVDPLQIGVVTAGTKALDLTGIGIWLGQMTSVSGSINKLITGDVRGWCHGDLCDKYQSKVLLGISGSAGVWTVESSMVSSTIALEPLLNDALARVLQPLMALRQPTP